MQLLSLRVTKLNYRKQRLVSHLGHGLAGLLLSLPLFPLISGQAAQAQGKNIFYCGTYSGAPATLIKSPRKGTVPIILWNSGDFEKSGWSDRRRCEVISRRLQTYQNNGKLRFLRTGQVGRYPVICVANFKRGSCPSAQTVITLPPGAPAGSIYEDLRRIAGGANVPPLELSDPGKEGQDPLFYAGSDPISNEAVMYLDVPMWLAKEHGIGAIDADPLFQIDPP